MATEVKDEARLVEKTREIPSEQFLQKMGELNTTIKEVGDRVDSQERLLKLWQDAEKERAKNVVVKSHEGPPVTYKKDFAELWAKGPDPRNEWEVEVYNTACQLKMLQVVAKERPMWGCTNGGPVQSEEELRTKWNLGKKMDALMTKATFWDPSTAASGGNWVPTLYRATPIDFFQLPGNVSGIFDVEIIPAGANTLRLPVGASGATFDSVAYATTPTLTGPLTTSPGQPDTQYIELVAKRNRGIINMDRAETEDAFIQVLDYGRRVLQRDAQVMLAETLINGQSDTNLDGAANGAAASRALFDGLRYYSILTASSATVDAGGTAIDVDDMMSMRQLAGGFAVTPSEGVFIVPPVAYFALQKNAGASGAAISTVEKYGTGAAILTGEALRIWGHPTIVSDRIPLNLATTGRRSAATGSTTCCLFVNRSRWLRGVKRDVTIETVVHAAVDQLALVALVRHAFDSAPPNTDKHTIALINVPNT